jgi:hypothetical protein
MEYSKKGTCEEFGSWDCGLRTVSDVYLNPKFEIPIPKFLYIR